MYFVEIDVIFFARLYCMISKWSVDIKKKQKMKKHKWEKKNLGSVSFIFRDKSLHADKGRAFWYHFTCLNVCCFFTATTLRNGPPATDEQNVDFNINSRICCQVVCVSNHPQRDANKLSIKPKTILLLASELVQKNVLVAT